MKISKTGTGKTVLIDGNGKEYMSVPGDWLLGRDLKSAGADRYFYVSPNGSIGGGIVIDHTTVTHLIKDGAETAWSGTSDALFTELRTNFFLKASVVGGGSQSYVYEDYTY